MTCVDVPCGRTPFSNRTGRLRRQVGSGRRLALALMTTVVSGMTTLGLGQPTDALAQSAPPPVTNTTYFGCENGQAEQYTVPANTSWLAITAWGASGAGGSGASGGHGAAVSAKVHVTAGQQLGVIVGCTGDSQEGWARGGNAGSSSMSLGVGQAGAGGGATGVQLCPSGSCSYPAQPAHVLVVAGGGGGGGGKSGTGDGGNGGSGSANGDRGQDGGGVNGGSGGSHAPTANGAAGWGTTDSGPGGGGGGGYSHGGDGGRGGHCVGCGGGGGGGGNSYTIASAIDTKIVDGGATFGNGIVLITPVRPTQPVPTVEAFGCNSGKVQSYPVPVGVTSIKAVVFGGAGASGDNSLGGSGGDGSVVTGTLPTSPGSQFGAVAGCSGGNLGGDGYSHGGGGGTSSVAPNRGGGGGGSSAVLSAPAGNPKPLLVAGGGGGAGDGQYSGGGGYLFAGDDGNGMPGDSSPLGGSGGRGGTAGAAKGPSGDHGSNTHCSSGGGGGGAGYPKGGTGGDAGGCTDGSGGGGGAGDSFIDASVQNTSVLPGGGGTSAGRVLMIAAIPGPPMAPTNVAATGTDSGATVTFTPPADNGGMPITSYTLRSNPGNVSITIGSAILGPVVFTGLTNGTQYQFTVVATNAAGDSAPSAPSNPITPRPFPGQPTITSVTPGDGQATVAFTPPAVGAPFISYTVTARTNGQVTGPGITATGATSPVTITGLTNGTTYIVTVYATNSSGSGRESPVSSVVPIGLPGAPTNVQATVQLVAGGGTASVAFAPPTNTGGAQNLSYTVTSNPGGTTATGNASPLTVTGLTNGTSYTFTVVATNAAGNGPASGASNAVTPTANQIPSPPLSPLATPGDRQAMLTFVPPLNTGGTPIVSYTVTSNPGGITATGTGSPITVTGLTNGTSYTFTVVATNAVGASQPSTVSNAVTPMAATAPSPPPSATASASNQGAIVSFAPPLSNGNTPITSFTVTSAPDGITATGTASPITITGLTNGTSYTFSVVATNAVGSSQPSPASNAVTPSASLAPANDNFANAQVITGGSGTIAGTNVNATTEAGEPGSGGASVWYAYSVSGGGVLQIDTCGSSFSPMLTAYTGSSLSALTPLGSSTVAVFCGATNTWISGTQVALPPNGGTIYLAVDGGTPSSPVTGSLTLHWGQGG